MIDEMALEEELARVPLRRATWARVFRYVRPYRRAVAATLPATSRESCER